VPFKLDDDKLLTHTLTDPSMATVPVEQYRALALSLENVEPKDAHRVLVVTSALPGEGKTLTVANLALTLSGSYRRRVLVVDGDLRRPRLYNTLSGMVDQATRAEESLPDSQSATMSLRRVGPSLFAVGFVDAPFQDPINTLNAPGIVELFTWARTRFDWVLVDTPPAALVSDASILAQRADGVLFVVHAATTPYDAASAAITQLGKERILGVVMNRVPKDGVDDSFRYYDAYGGYYAYSDAARKR
jgi:protein-tyrosine kinase